MENKIQFPSRNITSNIIWQLTYGVLINHKLFANLSLSLSLYLSLSLSFSYYGFSTAKKNNCSRFAVESMEMQ